jgi:GAF domain-containing protein
MTPAQDDTISELQCMVAELRRERDAGLAPEAVLAQKLAAQAAELAARNSEYGERLKHQSATIDVLKVMSASPTDPQPVFDLIVRRASELCNVPTATLFEYDGEMVHWRSSYGIESVALPDPLKTYLNLFPIAPTRGSISCRAILDRETVHVRDLNADPALADFVRQLGHRSQVSVPLIRQGAAIGAISIGASEPGGFTDSQIALLQTFAEQAVIAITSAETYRALQRRTSDFQEALEQQTATAEVLQVINASPGDLTPVFDAILEKAHSLCGAATGSLQLCDTEFFRAVATRGLPEELANILRQPRRSGIRDAFLNDAPFVQIADIADPVLSGGDKTLAAVHDIAGVRTLLRVPLRKDDALLGVIIAGRREVRPFSQQEISLLQNFAAQAVIAMENARLLTEQREALEQQTAMAEVLQVINASPGDLLPVFDAILDKAIHLCEATHGHLFTHDGDRFHAVAIRGDARYIQWQSQDGPVQPGPSSPLGRIGRGERIIHIADVREEEVYRTVSGFRQQADIRGVRSQIILALRKEDSLLGAMVIYRQEVRTFTDKQLGLLQNFAAQAVIAMENARLLDEIRQRQEELRVTFENMGDGVALFDETRHLVA